MTDRFMACLALTLGHEGGWSDDPHDPGGPTNRGITIATYAGFLGVTLSKANYAEVKERLRHITDAEYTAIYKRNYWDAVRADELPAGVDFAAWDFCVNAGPVVAVRCMQRAVGVADDGHLGAVTLDAVRALPAAWAIGYYLDERRAYYRTRPTFWRFGKGWLARCDAVEKTALGMAWAAVSGAGGQGEGEADRSLAVSAAPTPTPSPIPDPALALVAPAHAYPLPDPDAQAASQGKAPPTPAKPPWLTELTLFLGGVGSHVGGFANGFAKWQAMAAPTPSTVLLAFLSEPLVLTGLAMTFSALTTYLWRRRQAV
jgi:lysozyme family protein